MNSNFAESAVQTVIRQLPQNAFIDPVGQNRAEIAALLHQAVDLLVVEMGQAVSRSPVPTPIDNEQLQDWANIPGTSRAIAPLMEEVRSLLTHSMNAAHPGYIGHMDSIPTTLSMVGDLLVSALNNNMLSVEMSPAFSRLEPLVMRQLAQQFGLGSDAGGVMVSGGSLANLQALTVARNQALDTATSGMFGLDKKPVFFVSEVAHTSMQKAAMMMGIGSEGAIALRTNANSQIDIADLKDKLVHASAKNQQPFAIVATAGTTVTGNIDPIDELAAIARENDLWFHVDAAYGGAISLSPKHKALLQGIDQADSVTFNPQKWLYVSKTCATLLFKHFDLLNRHFRIHAPYMGDDQIWPNLGEFTVQGTRHADILKLWLTLQHLGIEGITQLIDHGMHLADAVVSAVRARPFLQLASEPQLNLVCFRLAPVQTNEAERDSLNQRLQRFLLMAKSNASDTSALCGNDSTATEANHSGIFLSLPRYRNAFWLKAVLLNPYTTEQTIARLFARIDQFAQENGLN